MNEPCWVNGDCIAGHHMDEIECRFPSWESDVSPPLTDFLLARIAEDEARVLAECEVKRRIVGRCESIVESRDHVLAGRVEQAAFPDVNRREVSQARRTLMDLALPYADHPDYDKSWRP